MQLLQDPNQNNVDNLNSVRCEAIRHFRNKKRECLKAKIDELEANSKIKNIRDLCRGISDFKGYQPRTNIVKNKKGDLFIDSHNTLARWKKPFLSAVRCTWGLVSLPANTETSLLFFIVYMLLPDILVSSA